MGLAVATLACVVRADLVGYWPLDGDARAAVGAHGKIIGGAAAAADRKRQPRGALAFDGAKRQHVAIPGGGGLDGLVTGTVSLWVRWRASDQGAGAGDAVFGAVLGRQKDGRWSSNLIGLTGPDPATARVRWR